MQLLPRNHNVVRAAAFVVASMIAWTANAQELGSQRYTVRVRPTIALNILRPGQVQSHPGSTDDLIFDDSLWLAQCNAPSGCTVRFQTDHAFQNFQHPTSKRDAELRIRSAYVTSFSQWQVDTLADQTDFQNGYEEANVQMSSGRAGLAYIFLRVRFITGDPTTLVGGSYYTTVTGTISEN